MAAIVNLIVAALNELERCIAFTIGGMIAGYACLAMFAVPRW